MERPERGPGRDWAALQREVGLTEEQAAALRRLRAEERKQAIRRRADLAIARVELEEALEAATVDEKLIATRVRAVSELQAAALRARVDRRLALRKVLTPEQRDKVRQLAARARCRRARRSRRRPPCRAGAVSGAALALTIDLAAARSRSEEDSDRDGERDLVRACQAGDREAFDRLVERHQRDVYRLCYRYLGNHEDASDLAQETFLQAWRALGRFRGESGVSTWLYRIAVNACLNHRAARRPLTQGLQDRFADPRCDAQAGVETRDRRARCEPRSSACPTDRGRR